MAPPSILRGLLTASAVLLIPLGATGQEVVAVGPGTYAFMTNEVETDSNKGFVIGSEGVLLVDPSASGIDPLVSAVRRVTSKPILYAVALNHHEDHSGGLERLPKGVTFLAHQATLATLTDQGRPLPPVTISLIDSLSIDLGGRIVTVRHVGAGNTPGDLVVSVPDAEVAYTGNLIYGSGSIPWLSNNSATAEAYQRTVARLAARVAPSVIVPGHGPITDDAILGDYAAYLAALITESAQAAASGASLDQAIEAFPYQASEKLEGAPDFFRALMPRIHRGNVELALRAAQARAAAAPPDLGPLDPGGPDAGTSDLGAFERRRLSDGVYALLPRRPLTEGTGLANVANGGFVVGERGVLVVDAGTNATVSAAIKRAVASVTELPIRYLVNTSSHGDHTFANATYAPAVVIAHSNTAVRMRADGYFEDEADVLVNVVGIVRSEEALEGVTVHPPDVTLERHLTVDLGGIEIQLRHFGPAHSEGDVVVHVPTAGVIWGGNFLFGDESIPFLFEGRPREFLEAVAAASESLDVRHVVTGHFSVTDHTIFSRYLDYLTTFLLHTRAAARGGTEAGADSDSFDSFPLPTRFQGQRSDFWSFMHELNLRRASSGGRAPGG